jgi:hypothetical protein
MPFVTGIFVHIWQPVQAKYFFSIEKYAMCQLICPTTAATTTNAIYLEWMRLFRENDYGRFWSIYYYSFVVVSSHINVYADISPSIVRIVAKW